VNNLINCSLECTEECVYIEFRFSLRDNGMHAAFQLLHMVLEVLGVEQCFKLKNQTVPKMLFLIRSLLLSSFQLSFLFRSQIMISP
jgi:hypothetical protein